MRGPTKRTFSLADLIDFELQMALDSRVPSEDLARREKSLRLDSKLIQAGKAAMIHAWIYAVRGPYGRRFLQLRQLVIWVLLAVGVLLGWGTARGLLTYSGQHPVNVLPFLAIFVLAPLLFLLMLLFKGTMSRLLGRLPGGWVAYSGQWILSRVMKKNQMDLPALDVWHRLQSLHPRLFTWHAWLLTQSFALAFYLTALGSFLFYVSFHDYAFAWQTTLRLGPEALAQLVRSIAWPFAFLGDALVPSIELIQATQYDRFSGSYVQGQGRSLAADWWPFLAAIIGFYGVLPRLLLGLFFQARIHMQLARMAYDDLASEDLWLRLQSAGLAWETEKGTESQALQPAAMLLPMLGDQTLLLVRWRQAPFRDEELRSYFTELGFTVGHIIDAEGRESEFQMILDHMRKVQALALICDPWELPGESFNRLRLVMRDKLPVRTPIFLVPLLAATASTSVRSAEQDRPLWEASLKAFRDPYVGLLREGNQRP